MHDAHRCEALWRAQGNCYAAAYNVTAPMRITCYAVYSTTMGDVSSPRPLHTMSMTAKPHLLPHLLPQSPHVHAYGALGNSQHMSPSVNGSRVTGHVWLRDNHSSSAQPSYLCP